MVNNVNPTNKSTLLSSSSTYPENLSEIADSADARSKSYGKYSIPQIQEATKKINAREYAAFGHLAGDASSAGIVKFAEAYVKYISQLSPEEQNSVRYKGTKESVGNLLTQARAQVAAEKAAPAKKTEEPDSLLKLLLAATGHNHQKPKVELSHAHGATNSTDKVTISDEARKRFLQG